MAVQWRIDNWWYFLGLFGFGGVIALVVNDLSGRVINHDVAWLMIAAERMLDGGSYGGEYQEINMPMAIFSYIPAVLISRFVEVSFQAGLLLSVGTMVLWSGMACFRQMLDAGLYFWQAYCLSMWIVIVLLLAPGYDFGQREHFVAILVVPFIMGLVYPPRGEWTAGSVVFFGMIGFLMKPHYAVMPGLFLIYYMMTSRPVPYGLKNVLLGFFIYFSYAAVVILFFRDWFDVAWLAGGLYDAYENGLMACLNNEFVFIVALMLSAWILCFFWRDSRLGEIYPILISVVAFLFFYLLQKKGWLYHMLPAKCLIFIVVGMVLSVGVNGKRVRFLCFSLLGLILFFNLLHGGFESPRKSDFLKGSLARALSGAKSGESVFVMTTSLYPALPTAYEMGLRWASRFPALWPLPHYAKVEAGYDEGGRLGQGVWFLEKIVEDVVRYDPDYIVVDSRAHLQAMPAGYDVLGFFMRDRAFGMVMSSYEKKKELLGYVVYVKKRG